MDNQSANSGVGLMGWPTGQVQMDYQLADSGVVGEWVSQQGKSEWTTSWPTVGWGSGLWCGQQGKWVDDGVANRLGRCQTISQG